MNFMFDITLNAVGNILRVHYESMIEMWCFIFTR